MADIDFSTLGFAPADPAPAPATASPASGAPAAPTGPVAFPDGLGGSLPDGSATRDPEVWKRWVANYRPVPTYDTPGATGIDLTQHGFAPAGAGDAPPGGLVPPVPPKDVPWTSRASNLAAGGNDTLASVAGAPVDLVTGGINLATRGVNAVLGTDIPPIVDPAGGSGTFKRLMGVVGANPDNVQPQDNADRVLRAAGAGITAAALPVGGTAAAVRTGLMAPATADMALGALGRFDVPNVAVSTAGSVAGDQAAQFVPDQYKPLANVAGSLVGGGAAAVAHGAGNSLLRYAEPVQTGAVSSFFGLGGQPNTLLDLGGQAIRNDAGQVVQATPGQTQMAGRMLDAASSDPQAVRAALADAPAPNVPGSQPTTFQVTRDPLLGQLERGQARDGGPGSAAFVGRSDAQNDAQVTALRGLAPDGNPAAVQAAAQGQASALDAAGQNRVQALQGLAGQALDRMGGNLPPGSDSQVGAALRAPLAATDQAAKAREGALWDAVDPDGTLAVDAGPLRAKAQGIIQSVGPFAPQLTGDEAAILNAAAGAAPAVAFSDLKDLRSHLTDTIAAARLDPGQRQTVRRLSSLLDGVHDSMAAAANDAPMPAAAAGEGGAAGGAAGGAMVPTTAPSGAGGSAPASAPRSAPSPVGADGSAVGSGSAAPNVGSEVFTPSGQRVGVRYELADAGNLVTSHQADGTPNPAFPPELQPRARDRAASQVQVANIASRLQPERLGASSTVADGAPIVGPDNLVESGNGRVMALRQAYQANGPQAAAYRDWLASQGHDTAGMAQPVLIRRRTTELTPDQRVAFAGEGSTPTTLAMSATERAAGDARRLSDELLQRVQPGDVTDPANRDFMRGFLRHVIEPGQEGSFVTADGGLSQEGASRVRAALVAKAYGDRGLSAALTETTDPTARVLAGAMQDAAGPMARLRAGIEAGAVDPKVDLAPTLVEATQVVQQARQRGISLADAVAQRDAFGGSSGPVASPGRVPAGGGEPTTSLGQRRAGAVSDWLAEVEARKNTAMASQADRIQFRGVVGQLEASVGKDGGATAAQAQWARDVKQFIERDRSAAAGDARWAAVSPLAEGILRSAYGANLTGRMSRERMGALLSDYARDAEQQATTAGLFGDNLTAQQLVEGVSGRYGKDAQAANGTTGASFVGSGNGQERSAGRGPVPGPGGQTAPGGGGGQQGGSRGPGARSVLPAPEAAALTPNFDQAAADRYAAARQATADRLGGFQSGPGVEAALQGGNRGNEFRQADAAVPAGIFKPGAAGAGHVQTYLAKGGSPQALQDAMAYSLRSNAMRPDGTLDPTRYAAWAKRYSSALSGLPQARQAFQTAAVAQEAVEAMAARHAAQVRDFQATAAARFLGSDDPVSTVGTLLRGPSAAVDMQTLAALTANNPDARAGLQRAVADYILRELKGDQATVTGGETRLRAAQLQAFVRKAGPALRTIMDDRQVATLQAVADDLQRGSLSASGTNAAGGSDTEQNRGAVTFGRALLGEGKVAAKTGVGLTTGATAGYLAGGPFGAALGGVVGAAPFAARALSNARAAGINTVNDLVREAMLNPELAKVLLARVTPQSKPNLAQALARVLGRASVLPPIGNDGHRQAPAGQPMVGRSNSLLPYAATAPGLPRNSLLDGVGR